MARIIFMIGTAALFFYGSGKLFARIGEFNIVGAIVGVALWGLLYAFGRHCIRYEEDKKLQRKANEEIIRKRGD